MENSILFIHDLFNASLPIDYEKQGDRWIQFLSEELHKENKDINGHGIGGNTPSSEFPYHHWGFSAHVNPNDKTKTLAELKIVPVGEKSSKGVYLFLVARQELTLEEIDLWKKCIDTAIKRLNEDNPTFSWAAALVQSNSLFSINTQYVLKRKAILKSMNIRPGRKPYIVNHKAQMPSFNGSITYTSWPIIIEGTASGYNWMVASQQAGQDIHDIAALLSLAWDSTWSLIQSPQQFSEGILKVPNLSHEQKMSYIRTPKLYKEIPKWVINALEKIGTHIILKNALNAYYQGLKMEEEHPSFALVAFVASMEAVGRTIIGDKCDCCGKENGSKQKFKACLSDILGNQQEIKRLSDAYGNRSDTAHKGVLYGNETTLGAMNWPSVFNMNDDALFIYTDFRKIKETARKSLIKAIKKLK